MSNLSLLASIVTPRTLTVQFAGAAPVSIGSDDGRFARAKEMLKRGELAALEKLLDVAKAIALISKGKFVVRDGLIQIDGESLPTALSDRLLALVDAGEDTTPLEKFWDNLSLNPSEGSRKDLFAFLEANNVPLTPDGHFIAYKKVRKDFRDIHSGQFDNSPGKVVSMPRSEVDNDSSVTCSRGLHVAAFDYAANRFGSTSEPLLLVKVNPADVVSVPPDYNQQKMRTCRYEVLEVHQGGPLTDLVKVAPGINSTPLSSLSDEELDDLDDELDDDEDVLDLDDDDDFEAKLDKQLAIGDEEALPSDANGRVRIPGRLIRQTGAGVGKSVYVNLDNVTQVLTLQRAKTKIRYTVKDDNSVRLGSTVLAQAGIDSELPVYALVVGKTVELSN